MSKERVCGDCAWVKKHALHVHFDIDATYVRCAHVFGTRLDVTPACACWTRQRPVIVCLCGSTRFKDAFKEANLRETLAGKIVLSIGCDLREDMPRIFGARYEPGEPAKLKRSFDKLRLRKIDLADEVLILDVDGYVGESTARELAYARAHGKRVRMLSEEEER